MTLPFFLTNTIIVSRFDLSQGKGADEGVGKIYYANQLP